MGYLGFVLNLSQIVAFFIEGPDSGFLSFSKLLWGSFSATTIVESLVR